jgi:hypothetical protein
MVYSTTQHPPPPPTAPTLSEYAVPLVWDGGGGQREGRGAKQYTMRATVYKLVENTNHELKSLLSIKSVNPNSLW